MKLKTLLEANSDSSMYDMNLTRLMDACAVKIDDEYYDELADYLTEIDADLNSLNIDDLVVNGIQYLDSDDIEGKEDNYTILKKDEKGAWVIN